MRLAHLLAWACPFAFLGWLTGDAVGWTTAASMYAVFATGLLVGWGEGRDSARRDAPGEVAGLTHRCPHCGKECFRVTATADAPSLSQEADGA